MCPQPRGRATLQAVKDVVEMLHDFRGTFVIMPPSGESDFIEAEDILREIGKLDQSPMYINDITDMEYLLKMAWKLWQSCLLGSRYRRTR
jgi:hypothetical protein